MMKKLAVAVALSSAFVGSAFADVTLYGVVDAGLSYRSVDWDGARSYKNKGGDARRTQPVSKCNSPVNPGCSILRGQSTLAHSPPSPSQFFTPIANVGANSFKQRSTDRARFRFFDACSCS